VTTRYLHGVLFLVLVLILQALLGLERSVSLTDLVTPLTASDSESRYARGEKVPFREATAYELEMIPGISDKLSSRILAKRDEILKSTQIPDKKRKHHPLEIVHGLGRRRRWRLASFWSFSNAPLPTSPLRLLRGTSWVALLLSALLSF
jgi:hypothetical protein